MAVAKMNKLSVIGLETEKSGLLHRLMDLGVVELTDQSEKLQDAEWSALVTRGGDADRISRLEGQLTQAETALEAIERYDTEKKPLFRTRTSVTQKAYQETVGDGSAIRQEIQEVLALFDRWNECKSQENVVASTRASLAPWLSYLLPLEQEGTRFTRIFLGAVPVLANQEEIRRQLSEASPDTVMELVSQDTEQKYLSVLCLRQEEPPVLDVLKGFGFTMAQFRDLSGTAQENQTRLSARLSELQKEEADLERKIAGFAARKKEIQYYCDSLRMQRDEAKASEKLLRTRTAFCFEGWVPEEACEKVKPVLEEAGCTYEIRKPEKGEETPVLLKNASLVVPFEAITSMYALPKSYEVDPTPIFAIFYFIFYGMMFADMGYGIILAGACFLLLKKFPLENLAYRLVKCLAFCGVSTFIWGALFGGFLGDLVAVVASTFFGASITIPPLWFDPLDDPMKLLIFSCVLGSVHLFIGMGIKAYMYLRDGRFADALVEVFAWYLFIVGVAMLLFGGNLASWMPSVGKWPAIAGAVIIVGGPLLRNKGVGRLLGLYDLYGSTSYLADILSYSRLLALGLSSAVIAQVFNALGSLFGSNILGAVLFVIIAILGHTLNFALNALGSYVHASRLQYVEFFGKFYEGGGEAFAPFEKDTKYVKILKEEE